MLTDGSWANRERAKVTCEQGSSVREMAVWSFAMEYSGGVMAQIFKTEQVVAE